MLMTGTENYLFENEYAFVTSDGRLIQKDNRHFKGRELARTDSEKAEAAVRYFEERFQALKAYADKWMSVLEETEDAEESLRQLDMLRRELEQADAVGAFDEVLDRVKELRQQFTAEGTAEHGASESASSQPGETSSGEEQQEYGFSASANDDQTAQPQAGASQASQSESDPSHGKGADAERPAGTDTEEAGAVETDMMETGTEGADDELSTYRQLVEKAEVLTEETDWQHIGSEMSHLKAQWQEGDAVPEERRQDYNELLQRFEQAEQTVEQRRQEHQRQQQEKRRKNIEQRQKLLEKLKNLVEEQRWSAFNEVRDIERKWEETRVHSSDESASQEEEFQQLLETFNQNKVDYLVEKRQKEEDNLTGKLVILDKMERLVAEVGPDTEQWEEYEEQIQDLTRQWRKIGRVPKENAKEILDRFQKIKDQYYQKKYEYNEAYRKEIEQNIAEKNRICEEAEQLQDEEDLALAARKMNRLHKEWKQAGTIPKEENDRLWERFKAASDAFNKRKSENLDTLKEQEEQNYQAKVALCEKAEAIQDTTDWEEGGRQMDALMDEWKKIGPAPRNKAGKVWKRFKKAMDTFYQNRREHFRQVRKEQKENLKEKRRIIEEIEKLAEHEDPEEAVRQVKPLQEKFKQVGFVPIKKKDKIAKAYKEACDAVYQRAREQRGGDSHQKKTGVKGQGAGAGGNRSDVQRKQAELAKLRKECERLNAEILHYNDTKTFIKPNERGMQLRDEIQQKIDSVQAELDKKNAKIEQLNRELQEIEEDT